MITVSNVFTLLNAERLDFDYYVERLLSQAIEDEEAPLRGKLWNLYINGVPEDWGESCRRNRIICKEDLVLWKYHRPHSDSHRRQIATLMEEAIDDD